MVVFVVRATIVLAMVFCFQWLKAISESLSPGVKVSSDRVAFCITSKIEENVSTL